MLYEIKRIPPGAAMKVAFFVFLIVGFLGGLFYSIILMNIMNTMGSLFNLDEELLQGYSGFGLFGLIVMGMVMAVFTSVIMTLLTGLSALCYNVIAGWLGGLKIELKEDRLDYQRRSPVPLREYPAPGDEISPPKE